MADKYKVGDRVVLGNGGYPEIRVESVGTVTDVGPSGELYEIDADDFTESNRAVMQRLTGYSTLPYWEWEIVGLADADG